MALICTAVIQQQFTCHAKAISADVEVETATAVPVDEDVNEDTPTTEAVKIATASDDNISDEDYFGLCHRVSRVVNFHEDLGFNFIIKPLEFDLGECVGYCSALPGAGSSAYLRLRTYLDHGYYQCCVPTEFESLDVALSIYSPELRRHVTSLDRFEDVAVKSCGCH